MRYAEILSQLESADQDTMALSGAVLRALFPKDPPNDDLKWIGRMPGSATGSVDGALALVDRFLPGWGYFIRRDQDGCTAGLLFSDAMNVTPGSARHAQQPIAICMALFIALGASHAD